MSDEAPRFESRWKAAEAGRSQYVGKPCIHCDSPVRYTSSNQCVVCTKARAAENTKELRRMLRDAKAGG